MEGVPDFDFSRPLGDTGCGCWSPVAIGTSVRSFFAILSEGAEGSTCLDFIPSSAS